jgi:hypothetical protein
MVYPSEIPLDGSLSAVSIPEFIPAQVQLTMATSPESKFVDRWRQASWVPQMVTYGTDWHCGTPFLGDFLFFLGDDWDAPYVFRW